MANIVCPCPITEVVPDLGAQACGLKWRQTSGLMFGKQGEAWTNASTPATDIQVLANWTTREAVSDDTKIQFLQKVSEFVVPEAASINIAPDTNTTPNGVQINLDHGTQVVTFFIRDLPVLMIDTLQTLACSSETLGVLGVILLSDSSVLAKDTLTPNFLPINNMQVLPPTLGGKTESNMTMITFNFDSNWYQNVIEIPITAFNPLTVQNT